ncbi:alpha/beta hydrolase [Mesobacterium sp. TK19101]|uniref:Palmitoyl-protein thioesterase ABHD10, mitochondrial n=1 Tax=Mesobacterium hydrothermale TaxID=3111907 RepID=A0ABU6HI51_9RHOB|nr:alpha/beta hydrolase [Mesobacterium sp. TK19101]MEC3862142.1 alpha/beta hydrolase [Mesobacterium sp. TK19101]
MTQPAFLDSPQGRRLAYVATPGTGPTVVFLSGYKSDMDGTKAVHLEAWARSRGRAFLRFDYSGHGRSGGRFEAGCIGDWADDAQAVLEALTDGPVILVGSSMGGWIASMMTQRLGRVAGFVGIASAPDFTEDGFWASFDESQRATLLNDGQVALPSDYGDPYIVTRRLIEDGRSHLVLRSPLPMPFPVRLLQGSADTAVSTDTLLRLFDHIDSPDLQMTLVKGVDHRFSDPASLALIEAAIDQVSPA